MTVAMRTISGPLEDEERQKALFEGTLLIFKNVEHLATYPITAGRAVALYPQYWGQPLKNTSAGWDLEEVKAGRIAAIVPEPTEPVDTSSELRIVIEPRDHLCFSGTHLHASVPYYTGLARFSIEVRSADVECEADGRGAPNLDGEAPHVAIRWFRRLEDDLPLSEALAGR